KALTGQGGAVSAVTFSPDGRRLASCGGDGKVLVWTLLTATGAPGLPELPPFTITGHSGPVSSVAFSPDGRFLASGGADQIVRVWELQSRSEVHSFRGHTNWISSVAFSPDGNFIASAGVDKTVKLWELVGREGTPGHGHTREVLAVAVSPDGKWIASGSADHSVRLWDAATGRERFTLSGHNDVVTALAFTPDGKNLVSAGDDRQLKVWSTETGKEVKAMAEPLPTNQVPVLGVTADGKRLVVWVANTFIETYDLAAGRQLSSWSGHEREISALSFSQDGALAAMGGKDGTVRIWDVAKRTRLFTADFPAHQDAITDLTLTPDKKRLVTADAKGGVKVWDLAAVGEQLKDGKQPKPERELKAHPFGITGLAMAPDGRRFASTGLDNTVKVWDLATGKELRSWDFHLPPSGGRPFVRALAFAPGGKGLVTANGNSTLYLLELP
ncbi:MAG TPA: WD40 repeat domain-containing protein, partial [Gemmataceae bacterium]|nr:WD40 repeat domain-containing protein [Gemmataceae bacterium]